MGSHADAPVCCSGRLRLHNLHRRGAGAHSTCRQLPSAPQGPSHCASARFWRTRCPNAPIGPTAIAPALRAVGAHSDLTNALAQVAKRYSEFVALHEEVCALLGREPQLCSRIERAFPPPAPDKNDPAVVSPVRDGRVGRRRGRSDLACHAAPRVPYSCVSSALWGALP